MLQLNHINKSYGLHKAVNDISLQIKQGEIFGLLGPNGAGKSSLLRMVTGITNPDSGTIIFNNEPFNLHQHSSAIGYMPEERGMYKKMKVKDQAIYLAQLKGLSKKDANTAINYWFKRLDMETWAIKKVEDLSKGMSQKLQFVITVAHQPKLLILDEPFSGLDPVNSEIIKNEIFHLAQQGTSIIFSTHRMEQVEEICEEIALLNKGEVVLAGNVTAIKQQFKENIYFLKLNNKMDAFTEYIQTLNDNYEYKLKLSDENEASKILQHCLQMNLQILEFREILPTLNEIFIRQINEGAVRQFNN
jgi:ABC-2 type transport system ATP-binding protein